MDRVAVAGLSLHHTDVEGLERVKRAVASGVDPLEKKLADALGASEVVCLSTCNRFEVVFARESGHPPGLDDLTDLAAVLGLGPRDPLRERLFLHSGLRAARHVFRVAASLDSLVVGEGEILAQMRAACASAQELGTSGRILGPLFEQAAQVGKSVRTRTDLAQHPISVVSLGVAFLSERLRGREAPRIAVIGAGATATHAVRALRAAGLAPKYVANRTLARAREVAAEVGAEAVALETLQRGEVVLDGIVSATSAPNHVLDARALLALAARTQGLSPGRTLVAVDLAVPRDLEPVDDARIERVDLEALRVQADQNRARRADAAAEAELLIEEHLHALGRERAKADVTGPYARVLADAREIFEVELARLKSGKLAHLPERERVAVERWARTAFGRLAHVPLSALKRLAHENGAPRGEWEGHE